MPSSNVEVRYQTKERKQNARKAVSRSYGKHRWTKREDVVLIRCLHVLTDDPRWKEDNGTFKTGYLSQLEWKGC